MFSIKLPAAGEALVCQRCFPDAAHLGANPENLFRHFTPARPSDHERPVACAGRLPPMAAQRSATVMKIPIGSR